MARGKKFHGNKKANKSFNKHKSFKKNYKKKPNRYMMVKRQMERNKESEEILKRQQLVELKYREKQVQENESESGGEENGEQEENHYHELLSAFKKSKKQPHEEAESTESSEDEEEEQQDNLENVESEVEEIGDEDEEEIDGVIPEESDAENEELSSAGSGADTSDEEVGEVETEAAHDKTINTQFLDDSIVNDLNRDIESDLEEEFDNDIENEDSMNTTKLKPSDKDPFSNHFNYDLSSELLDAISSSPPKTEITKLNWDTLGNLIVEIPRESSEPDTKKRKHMLLGDETVFCSQGTVPKICNPCDLVNEISIKQQIVKNLSEVSHEILNTTDDGNAVLTKLETEVLSIAANYQDLYYPHRTHANGEELRLTYCIHALNHVLKTRRKVLHHNAKLSKLKAMSKISPAITDELRDQGFVRPRVLIVLPFRESAYRVVNMLLDLLNPKDKTATVNYKRFVDEFSGQTLHFPKKNPKPDDYELTFAGNTEDTFRIGISLTRNSMKLYAPFYSSDILIASPLGLRLIIGAPGEKDREYDFLASIELLVLDQMELFLAQNWDHLLYLFDHLHLQPQSRQNTDFSRVRSWCLNGWSKFYRQTLLFSSYDLPEFRSLFNNRCRNYHGKVRTANVVQQGTIRHVVMEIPQIFHRIDVQSLESSFSTRFDYFTNTILPEFKSATKAHTMIYVPSYFDYVRIRNYLKKEEVNFTQICEYTKDNKISRARTLFYHGGAHFLLYSERVHFFRRMRIKGIRHLIMYQPPMWSNFYPEIVNFMQDVNQNPNDDVVKNLMSITVLYTKFDLLQLSAIIGHENVSKMLGSKKNTHVFMNNE